MGYNNKKAYNVFRKFIRKENCFMNSSGMTEAEFDAELEKGYHDIISGDAISAKCAFKAIREEYNL